MIDPDPSPMGQGVKSVATPAERLAYLRKEIGEWSMEDAVEVCDIAEQALKERLSAPKLTEESLARATDPDLWAKIDEWEKDDDWNGAAALNARQSSLKNARAVLDRLSLTAAPSVAQETCTIRRVGPVPFEYSPDEPTPDDIAAMDRS